MKLLLLTLLALVYLSACDDQYTDRYDDINIEEILGNRRLLMPYLKCILNKGRCTPEGKELKVHITDAMQTGCQKCTLKQRQGARKVVKHIQTKEPEQWKLMLNKYDPDGKYRNVYEPFLEAND